MGIEKDYSLSHVLLSFLAEFVENSSCYKVIGVEMVRNGCLRFRLKEQDKSISLLWSEGPRLVPVEVAFSGGVVSVESPQQPGNQREKLRQEKAAGQVAQKLVQLLRGNPPHLLQWRNRNPQRIQWGVRMFNNLCPNLLIRGHTRYFGYTVSNLDQHEGFVNVEFQGREATVKLRLTLAEPRGKKPLISWGPISLVILEDERSSQQRKKAEHQVEEFLGYILSRNLPPRFSLEFEFNDPPAGYLPPDHNIDFIRMKRLDDTSFFEMLFSSSEDIGVVASCDRECFNLFSLVSSPKESWTTIAPWQVIPSPNYLRHCYNANLTSRSTVMGSDNIERCLKQLASSCNPPKLIIFFDSCLHRLIGEDLNEKLRRFREDNSIPLVYYDIRTTQHPYLRQLRDFWKNIYLQVSRPEQPPEPARVCFLGLSPDPGEQIKRVLEAFGIRTGARIFPFLMLHEMKELSKSSLVIANRWEYVRIMFTDMLSKLNRPVIRLPLPFGIEGTSKWLNAIHEALFQKQAPIDKLPEIQRCVEEFQREQKQVQGQRIGLFSRLRGVKNRLSPLLRFGVPLLDLFHELGLGVDLNLFIEPEEEEPGRSELGHTLGLDSRWGDSISFFHHSKQLPEKLRNGEFSIVYTETFRDERICAAGKSPLSLNQLAPGYQGAVQTARLVRGMLTASFFRRHHTHLPSPTSHYRF